MLFPPLLLVILDCIKQGHSGLGDVNAAVVLPHVADGLQLWLEPQM